MQALSCSSFHSDVGTLIGSRHAKIACPSQDWALAGDHWVVVADGCSSGRHADMGARVYTHAADALIRHHGVAFLYDPSFAPTLIQHAHLTLHAWTPDDGLATVVAAGWDGGRWLGFIAGDGFLVIGLRDGSKWVMEVDAQNMPCYLDYFRTVPRTPVQECTRVVTKTQLDGQGNVVQHASLPVGEDPYCVDRFVLHEVLGVAVEDIHYVAACTDGVASLPGELYTRVHQLFWFKGMQGEFVKRRMGKQQAYWLDKENASPADDLTVGVVVRDVLVAAA